MPMTTYGRSSRTIPAAEGLWAWWSIEAITERVIDYRGRTPPSASAGLIPHVRTTQIRDGRVDWKTDRFVTQEARHDQETLATWSRCKPLDVDRGVDDGRLDSVVALDALTDVRGTGDVRICAPCRRLHSMSNH